MQSTKSAHAAHAEKDSQQNSPDTVYTDDIVARIPGDNLSINVDSEAQINHPARENSATEGDGGDGDGHEYPTGAHLGFIIVALVLGVFLVILDTTIVATAIPKITDEFHRLDEVSWYGAAFFVCTAAFQSTWGKAYKYFPLKICFLVSIFIFEVGSLICGVAPNGVTLIVGRAIAGIGGAGIASGAYIIIGFSARPAKRPVLTGVVGASYGVASVTVADVPNQVAVPVAVPYREKLLQMDPLGTALIMGFATSFLLALQYGGIQHPWGSSVVIGLFAGSGLILAAFVALEWFQGERSMIASRLLKDRTLCISSSYAFFFAGGYFVLIYYLPIYFQSIHNVSPTMSGVRNLPLIIAATIATIVSGASITNTGIYAPILVGSAAVATVAAGLIYTLDIGTGSGKWISYQVLAGLAWGAGIQVPMIATQGTSKELDLASETAILLFFQIVGSAFFVAAAQTSFLQTMLKEMREVAPQVSQSQLVQTGATEIRQVFDENIIPLVIRTYMEGLKDAFTLVIAATGVAFAVSLGTRWSRLKTNNLTGSTPLAPSQETP
ncbi:major facilitator superfamily domain-containing protein [Dactylonectria macrodidyma]|uniref:Major facilitator superfamily domain-containing protein n=1 Tax=Dactylonectria macrodidyma TaxID=307937 RepID=A0A9P9FXH0_9HYPO|nr:major facilitator superfamily domain-containing protein [Dactylonectria macrodidyma]